MPFKRTKEEEGRPVMVKRKLDGAVDKSSLDREIRKSNATVHNEKSGGEEPGLMAGWLTKFGWLGNIKNYQIRFDILSKAYSRYE